MAFQRISLKGFSSEFNVRQRVELYNGVYICWTTLYRGTHLRRKVDELVSKVTFEAGKDAALDRCWELREQLLDTHGLERNFN